MLRKGGVAKRGTTGVMNENANVVNPEHAIDHNSFEGVAYVPVRKPSD